MPAAFQLSMPELIQVYTALRATVQAWLWPLPDSRPVLGALERVKAGRGGAQVLQVTQRVFRIPESESRACAPGPDYKLVFKGSLWFFFSSLSLFFVLIGTKKN